MKMVTSLLLASAAGLVATAGAQAADLPVKAKAVEYVKICSLYGIGFYYIPGTDTCIRIGGHLRSEYGFGNNVGVQNWGSNQVLQDRASDYVYNRQRVFMHTDVRTQTEYGPCAPTQSFVGNTRLRSVLLPAVQTLGIDIGFIQWGGFLIVGRLTRHSRCRGTLARAINVVSTIGSSDWSGGRFVTQYTYQFGNGVAASAVARRSEDCQPERSL